MVKKIFLLAAMGLSSLPAISQIKVGNGQISGSLESNNIYYFKDDGLDLDTPADRFGSNDYLKVDYSIGKFSAGILAEGYMPALQGIDPNYKGIGLTSKYVQWQDKNFSFLVGDVYDQFGSGIVFRSFEDRALGFNNSLEGVRGGSPSGNVTGEELGAGTLIKGSIVPKEFIIPLPAKTKAENAKIVVYVSTPDTDGGKLYINNVVVCKVGAPVAFKYND